MSTMLWSPTSEQKKPTTISNSIACNKVKIWDAKKSAGFLFFFFLFVFFVSINFTSLVKLFIIRHLVSICHCVCIDCICTMCVWEGKQKKKNIFFCLSSTLFYRWLCNWFYFLSQQFSDTKNWWWKFNCKTFLSKHNSEKNTKSGW